MGQLMNILFEGQLILNENRNFCISSNWFEIVKQPF